MDFLPQAGPALVCCPPNDSVGYQTKTIYERCPAGGIKLTTPGISGWLLSKGIGFFAGGMEPETTR